MTRAALTASGLELKGWRTHSDMMDVRFADLPFTLETFAARHFQEVVDMYGEVCEALPGGTAPDFDEYAGIYENHFLAGGGNWALEYMIGRHEESDDLLENGERSEFCTLSTFLDLINDDLTDALNLSDMFVMVPMERALEALLAEAFRVNRAARVITAAVLGWIYRPGGRPFLEAQARWGEGI